MFTGIIQATKPVVDIQKKENHITLAIKLDELTEGLMHGASVAVNGVCLTVINLKDSCAYFDIIPETLEKTNLGELKLQNKVNIERAMKVGDELGGHWVLGHVDGVAVITKIEDQNHYKMWLKIKNKTLMPYIVSKGCITLDGVSLTIVDAKEHVFSVCLIPETLKLTTLASKKVGDNINIECDYLAKLIINRIKQTDAI